AAGALSPERRAAIEKRLDAALANPAQFAVTRLQGERQKDFEGTAARFYEEKKRLAPLRASAPQRYADEWRALIERREAQLRDYADLPFAVGARQELAREYGALAAFLRFSLKRPDDAIAAYRKLAALQPAGGLDGASLAIADVLRFDKREPKAAA